MTDGIHPLVEQLVRICVAKGVCDFIVAPGSRSAPLTIALARHPEIRCRVVYDERAAGYIALGLAQQRRRTVGLVCTSGTAAVNFGPAVVEAFYQGVPLLILTADRPPEWIDQQDNQAIHQAALYAPHVRGSYVLPLEDGHADTAWFGARVVAQAIDQANGWQPGPVHINVPLREPLYPPPLPVTHEPFARPVIHTVPATPRLDDAAWPELVAQWQTAERKLLVAGLYPLDAALSAALASLARDPSVAIFADATANLQGLTAAPAHADMILATQNAATLDALRPDLVVVFGGQVTSKYLKALIRRNPPRALWFVGPGSVAPDTYQALTHRVPALPAAFFAELASRVLSPATTPGYQTVWADLEQQASTALSRFLAQAPFGEFVAVHRVLRALPAGTRLQVGNSMAIRYVNFLGVQAGHFPIQVNSNRGASGIDGTVSTAVGAALADDILTTLIVGDLGFFYDRNGLWHRHVPPNLRVVVLNNHGGGIFDIIDGPNRLPAAEHETYFLTPQPLSARRTAADHELAYWYAATDSDLCAILPAFFTLGHGPALLEIETTMAVNTALFQQFKAVAGALQLPIGEDQPFTAPDARPPSVHFGFTGTDAGPDARCRMRDSSARLWHASLPASPARLAP